MSMLQPTLTDYCDAYMLVKGSSKIELVPTTAANLIIIIIIITIIIIMIIIINK